MLEKVSFQFVIFLALFVKYLIAEDINCTGDVVNYLWTKECMDFHSNEKSFEDAENECLQKYNYTHLYSIHSIIENNAGLLEYGKFLAQYNTNITHLNEAWIGLSIEYGSLKWNDGEKIDFVKWNLENTNHSLELNEKYCISFNLSDGTWQPRNCLEKKPFICGIPWEFDDSDPGHSTTVPPKFCDNPCFQGSCIFYQSVFSCSALYTNFNTFYDAENACSSNGGHLLSILYSNDNDEFHSQFDHMDYFFLNAEAWIGMYTFDSQYYWIDISPVSYINVDPNFTLNANEKYCVSFVFGQKFWKVTDCSEKKLFFCSLPNSTATTPLPFLSSTTTLVLTSTELQPPYSTISSSISLITTTPATATSTTTPSTPPQIGSTPTGCSNIIAVALHSTTTEPITSRFLSTLSSSTTLSQPQSSSKFKIWQLLIGIFIFIIIVTAAFITFYIHRKRKQAKERKKFLLGHVSSMMESVVHMFKQNLDKRDIWKLDEKDVHINLNKSLGKGFNADVYAGTFKETSEISSSINFLSKKSILDVAIKIPKEFEKEKNVETFVRELDALIALESHPHIIKFIGWILYENTPVFVLELATISLLEYSKSFREEKEKFPHKNMLSIIWQISQALIYISSKLMIHRDIACRNVLLTDTNIAKLADFGLCCHCNEKFIYQASTNKRLPYKWLSIEAIVDNTFSEKSDVWAFGILAFEAYSFGAIPYSTLTNAETLEFLQSGSRLEKPAEAFETLYELMLKCWEKEVEVRPTFKEIEKYLRIMLENETYKYGYLALDSSSSKSSGIINILQ